MRINRALWIMVLTGASSALSAEAQQRANRAATASQVSGAPAPPPASRAAATNLRPLADRALSTRSEPQAKASRSLAERFRVERQKTPFVKQTRLPLVQLWDGRIEIACVHQRLRDVHSHSAVVAADQAALLRPDRIPYLQPESRASYGGGIWLTFGRPRGTVRKAA